jgi:hypothetical protein
MAALGAMNLIKQEALAHSYVAGCILPPATNATSTSSVTFGRPPLQPRTPGALDTCARQSMAPSRLGGLAQSTSAETTGLGLDLNRTPVSADGAPSGSKKQRKVLPENLPVAHNLLDAMTGAQLSPAKEVTADSLLRHC